MDNKIVKEHKVRIINGSIFIMDENMKIIATDELELLKEPDSPLPISDFDTEEIKRKNTVHLVMEYGRPVFSGGLVKIGQFGGRGIQEHRSLKPKLNEYGEIIII